MSTNFNSKFQSLDTIDANDVRIASTAFYATYKMFRNYLGYYGPLPYELWLALPEDRKAAGLFVQFYDTINLAWYRLKTPAAIEEDCVSEVIKYLIKNVSKIEEDAKRYSPKYIYRVVYNCIYCKSVDPYNGQTAATSWYTNNVSPNISSESGEEMSLFDTMVGKDEDAVFTAFLASDAIRSDFWKKIYDMGPKAVSVVCTLMDEHTQETRKLPRVSEDEFDKILSQLRIELAEFKNIF